MDDTPFAERGTEPDLPTLDLTDVADDDPLSESFDGFDDDDDALDDHNDDEADPDFTPVPVRHRHDGWTPQKQHDFIAALAESGCVTEACRAVGMSPRAAYNLRARPDATIFRQAWDVALDHAIRRLSDAAFSRALHGVVTPIFYQGEQIGERRRYDERLTMFLLRYRDPVRYGAWNDDMEARRHPDGAGIVLAHALNAVMDAAHGEEPTPDEPGRPLREGPPPSLPPVPDLDPDEDPGAAILALCEANERNLRKAALAERTVADGWRSVLPVTTPRIRQL